jgi:DNA-binding NarL/FixJ family response regulator
VSDKPFTVVLVGAQRLMLDALKSMLSPSSGPPLERDIEVIGEATGIPEAVETTKALRPASLVLDIPTPDTRGTDAIARLLSECPGVRIVGLADRYDAGFLDFLLRQGVGGYVLKSDPGTELVRAIRVVAHGGFFFSHDVAVHRAAGRRPLQAERKPIVDALGPRERQVLALIANGRRSQDIAARLHLSIATIEVHRRNIMRKLDLHSVAELTKYAIRERLIVLD